MFSKEEGERAWDDQGATARFLYLDVACKMPREQGTTRVYVRDDEAYKHEAEIAELARSLLQGEDEPDIWGLMLNNNKADRDSMVLPDWKKAYVEEAEAQLELNQDFVKECQTMYNLDRALIHHHTLQKQSEQDNQADSASQHEHMDHRAYFALLHNLHCQSHPLRPRLSKNRLVLGPQDAALLRYHYWMMILDPDYQPPSKPLELILKRAQLYHTADPTEEDVMELLRLAWEVTKAPKWELVFDGLDSRQGEGEWMGPYVAPWILTARTKRLAFLVTFLVLGIWVWLEHLAGLSLHVWLGEGWERFRKDLDRSHISVLQNEAGDEDWTRLSTGKSLHDELRDCEASQDEG
jgi:hypothetical protein